MFLSSINREWKSYAEVLRETKCHICEAVLAEDNTLIKVEHI